MLEEHLPLLFTVVIAGILGGFILVLSAWLGPKRPSAAKSESFECGNPPSGHARSRFAVKFFLVAILFLVFDIEAVFVYPWSVVLFDSTRGAVQQVNASARLLDLDPAALESKEAAQRALGGVRATTPAQLQAQKVLEWAVGEEGFDWEVQAGLSERQVAHVMQAQAARTAPAEAVSKPPPLLLVLEMLVFVAIILVGLAYAWRKGALEWGPEKGRAGSPHE